MNFFDNCCTTGTGQSQPFDSAKFFSDMANMKQLIQSMPKPLSVIYLTPGGMDRLKECVDESGLLPQFLMPLGSVRLVEFPTVDLCQTAAMLDIELGRRSAVLTESVWFDPVEAAREWGLTQ